MKTIWKGGRGSALTAIAVLLALAAMLARLTYTGSTVNPSAAGAVNPSAAGADAHGGAVAPAPAAQRPAAPDLAFVAADGTRHTLADFRGRAILVNLWATWCPPCIAEMPGLDALQAKAGGPGFQVVPIALDRGGVPVARHWLEAQGLLHLETYAADPAQFSDALLPTSILIDKAGRVAWRGEGRRDWQAPVARDAIAALAAEPAP